MALRDKHLKLEQTKLDRARRLIGAKTERETVEHALDVLLGEEPILRVHRRFKSVGGFVDPFGRAR
jgi:Bacterial antitoxin of type II TA system, VapB